LPLDARVALLLHDYEHFTRDLDAFCDRLDALRAQCSNATVDRWQEAARAGRLPEVVRELLLEHYDPIYTRSIERNFSGYAEPLLRLEWDGSEVWLEEAAARAAARVMP